MTLADIELMVVSLGALMRGSTSAAGVLASVAEARALSAAPLTDARVYGRSPRTVAGNESDSFALTVAIAALVVSLALLEALAVERREGGGLNPCAA